MLKLIVILLQKAQEPNMIMKMIIALSIQRYYISFE